MSIISIMAIRFSLDFLIFNIFNWRGVQRFVYCKLGPIPHASPLGRKFIHLSDQIYPDEQISAHYCVRGDVPLKWAYKTPVEYITVFLLIFLLTTYHHTGLLFALLFIDRLGPVPQGTCEQLTHVCNATSGLGDGFWGAIKNLYTCNLISVTISYIMIFVYNN